LAHGHWPMGPGHHISRPCWPCPGRPCLQACQARRPGALTGGTGRMGGGGKRGSGSPWVLLWSRFGRRRASGGESEAAELRYLRGRSGWRRRFQTTRLDSLDGSEEGGTAEPLDSLGSLGRPRTSASGGDRGGGYARAQRRRVEGERAGELERRKGEGGLRGVQQWFQRGSPHRQDKQEVALGTSRASTQLLTVQRKKTRTFCKKPPGLWNIFWIFWTALT
jgi:hypothetical protein